MTELDGDRVMIESVHCGLALTTDNEPSDRSKIWLAAYRHDPGQQWRIRRSEDGHAFQIEGPTSTHVLDSDYGARIPATGEDHSIGDPTSLLMFTDWSGECQQWTIARLP
jgi:hypothetical protein